MRDPDRIPEVLAALNIAWRMNPDMRLTQLLWNIARFPGETASGFYNMEDDRLLETIRTYMRTGELPSE